MGGGLGGLGALGLGGYSYNNILSNGHVMHGLFGGVETHNGILGSRHVNRGLLHHHELNQGIFGTSQTQATPFGSFTSHQPSLLGFASQLGGLGRWYGK